MSIQSIRFVEKGIPLDGLAEGKPHEIFCDAIRHANQRLENVIVFFKKQLPEEPVTSSIDCQRNILLGIRSGDHEEPIDIIDIKALDNISIKSTDELAEEIVLKVEQHLLARKISGIAISLSGSKFDTRKLVKNSFTIDEEGYLSVNASRVASGTGSGCFLIKAEMLHSYTIIRLIEDEEKIRILDDYDLVRRDNRGMFIDLRKDGDNLVLKRDVLSLEMKALLSTAL